MHLNSISHAKFTFGSPKCAQIPSIRLLCWILEDFGHVSHAHRKWLSSPMDSAKICAETVLAHGAVYNF